MNAKQIDRALKAHQASRSTPRERELEKALRRLVNAERRYMKIVGEWRLAEDLDAENYHYLYDDIDRATKAAEKVLS